MGDISAVTQLFERIAAEERKKHFPNVPAGAMVDAAALDELNYKSCVEESRRINEKLEEQRNSQGSFIPAIYLRGKKAAAGETLRLLRSTSKAFELDLRFKEIAKLDEMHAKLWELLNVGGRTCVNEKEYIQLLDSFERWAAQRFGGEVLDAAPLVCATLSTGASPDRAEEGSAGEEKIETHKLTSMASDRTESDLSSLRYDRQGSMEYVRDYVDHLRNARQHRIPTPGTPRYAGVMLTHAEEDDPVLDDTRFLCTIAPPRPSMELFLSCPRNAIRAVDNASIYQAFAKQVSLVKCEAELIMWDSNNDGRLSEDEVEVYVRDLAPRIAALRSIGEDVLPFYCCTVSRRLFWDLDPGNRGVLRIHTLLQSAVMDEWVGLQLLSEDNPQNWFGAAVTQQLYDKFLLLDSRNEGTLNEENLRRYKKGLPTVIDDGLPLDTSPLSTLFIDRYFETNVVMARSEMDYRKFVDFVLAVELLPQCSRPSFFWNILDLEGHGVLTPMIVNYFFRETHAKLVSAGLEVPSRETVVVEVFDLIETAEPLLITREEFMRSSQAGLFVALLIDCLSFWTYENREQR